MHDLRKRLAKYFESEGRDLPVKVELPKGQYRLAFTDNLPPTSDPIQRFWHAHIASPEPSAVIYGEPIFFRDDKDVYLRSETVESPREMEHLLGSRRKDLVPSFAFVSSGDMAAVVALMRLFNSYGAKFDVVSARDASPSVLRHNNLILLGNPRVNEFISRVRDERESYRVTARGISEGKERRGGPSVYTDAAADDRRGTLIKYALLTRRPGFSDRQSLTLIEANYGRARYGVADFLSRPHVGQLLDLLAREAGASVPHHFQAVFRVIVSKEHGESEIYAVEPVTVRIYAGEGKR